MRSNQDSIQDFMDLFIVHFEKKVEGRFRLQRDKAIAYAVMKLFKTRDNIETYNKKALYILIREMTGAKTQYITKVVKKIKKEYETLYLIYQNNLFHLISLHLPNLNLILSFFFLNLSTDLIHY